MAPKPQKREYSAVELAMLDDIGAGRVDELPLEDRGTVPRDGAAMSSIESRRTGTQNTWNDAIARGAFEDEDAAVVVGQRELGNGQLARMRRAADLSYMAVNRNLDYNDRRLRQNHNGQVAPRAQFSRGERGPARAGLAHTGDSPVELRGATRASRQPPVTTITAQRPIDGHSVLFQAPVTFASPTFINRTGEYPGTVYLVNGPSTVDDQIILHIDEDRVEDVMRHTKDYVDYLSDSDRLILQFKDDSGHITWFVVIFRQRDTMVSFVDALRDFVDRLKKPSPSLASTNTRPSTVGTPAASIEPSRDAPAPIVESPRQEDTMKTVSVAILEDIVSWAIHIVAFIRDAGPAELANADALPGIIRGASAAVLMEKHAGFSDMESKQRVAFVDEVCVPKHSDFSK
ncbi:hypothetical protein F5883DRAFT_611599 [Diaporthe sp. PMI_573]|nr:hypothetical protein F5883DRAFT_611599 [Diaporthaceae sp. PMI_573]